MNRVKSGVWVAAAASLLALAGCDDNNTQAAAEPAEIHFEYEGTHGPEHWGALKAEWATCSAGVQQSPIDIPLSIAPSALPLLQTAYNSSALTIFNNGHTVQVNYDPGSTLTVGGNTWQLLQFHFHTLSEHAIGGQYQPLEMHLVHRDTDGRLAVVGVMIKEGAENATLKPVFDNLPPHHSDPHAVSGVSLNIAQALPADLSAWRYDGSLTTPPCSEGVRWHVLSNPITASAAQIGAFRALFETDARPVQPLNGRTIQ